MAPDGHRCGTRGFIEFHHLDPRAAGGKATVDRIALRCRAHNQYEAEVFFGPGREYVAGMERVDTDGMCQERAIPDSFLFRNERSGGMNRPPEVGPA